jgi:hypothetical protein
MDPVVIFGLAAAEGVDSRPCEDVAIRPGDQGLSTLPPRDVFGPSFGS